MIVKKVTVQVLILILVLTLSSCEIEEKSIDDYQYAYLLSTTATESKSLLKLYDIGGDLVSEVELPESSYTSLDSNELSIFLPSMDTTIESLYDKSSFELSHRDYRNLTNNSDEICSGRIDSVIATDNGGGAYLINNQAKDDHYSYLFKYGNMCYELPMVVEFYYHNKDNNTFGFFGPENLYNGTEDNFDEADSFEYYVIDIETSNISRINSDNLEETFSRSISSGEIEMSVIDGVGYVIFSEYSYKPSESINARDFSKKVYIASIELDTGKMIKKEEIQLLTSEMFDVYPFTGIMSKYFMFENERLYYFWYDGRSTKLLTFTLDFEVVNQLELPNISNQIFPHINTLKVHEDRFYITYKEEKVNYLYVYDLEGNVLVSKSEIDFGVRTGLSIYGFDIK